METKIIHHLDYDCSTLAKEIRFVVNGRLEAIFFKHPKGGKILIRNRRIQFESEKEMSNENLNFIRRTRQIIPRANAPMLLKRL